MSELRLGRLLSLESPYARQAAEALICVVAEQGATIAELRAALVEARQQYGSWIDAHTDHIDALLERTKP